MTAIRANTDPVLRTAGLLVRPHPQNAAQWAEVDLDTDGGAAIWPRGGANPIGLDARREYYDSMYHAHAVVGINTSALIESGIVGRLVYSVTVPEFSSTQEGTLHFRHLRRGGLLSLADTLDEHVAQLVRSFALAVEDRERVRQFIRSFVRPHGLGGGGDAARRGGRRGGRGRRARAAEAARVVARGAARAARGARGRDGAGGARAARPARRTQEGGRPVAQAGVVGLAARDPAAAHRRAAHALGGEERPGSAMNG